MPINRMLAGIFAVRASSHFGRRQKAGARCVPADQNAVLERRRRARLAVRGWAIYREACRNTKPPFVGNAATPNSAYQKYPRDHTWSFDGGHTMTGTAAPAYLGNPANVDPEEAFVAALSSCHMLTFLAIACKQKFVLDRYEDEAVGHMEKNAQGKMAITRVELHPKITWCGDGSPARRSSTSCITRLTRIASSRTRSRPR